MDDARTVENTYFCTRHVPVGALALQGDCKNAEPLQLQLDPPLQSPTACHILVKEDLFALRDSGGSSLLWLHDLYFEVTPTPPPLPQPGPVCVAQVPLPCARKRTVYMRTPSWQPTRLQHCSTMRWRLPHDALAARLSHT